MNKQIHISDAIPAMPASFEQTVERTLASVCTEQRKQTARGAAPSTRQWAAPQSETKPRKTRLAARIAAVSVAAVLVVSVLVIGGVVVTNALRGLMPTTPLLQAPGPDETDSTPQASTPNTLPPMLMYHGIVYRISESAWAFAGEIDESAVRGTVRSTVAGSEQPTTEGQANFPALGARYAMTADGLVVEYGNEWRLFVPVLPDAEAIDGSYAACVLDYAYREILLKIVEADRQSDAKRAELANMPEAEAGEYETALDYAETANLARRNALTRMQENKWNVGQKDGDVVLSQIAIADGQLYLSFAAPLSYTFDEVPVVTIGGHDFTVLDDTAFLAPEPTETEHYSIVHCAAPPEKAETVQITVALKNSRFAYTILNDTVYTEDAEEAPLYREQQADIIPVLFTVDGQTVTPKVYLSYAQEGGSIKDYLGFAGMLQRNRINAADEIPTVAYTNSFGFDVQEGTLFAAYVLNTSGERLDVDVTPRGGDSTSTGLNELSPGTYYVAVEIEIRTDAAVYTYQCVCGIEIKE